MAIKAERHDRLAILVKGQARIGQHFTANQGAALDQQGWLLLLFTWQDFGARRDTASRGLLQGDAVINHLEGQFGGLADHALKTFGIAFTRGLDHDPVGALANNGWLACAQRIDPATDDFDGLLDRLDALGSDGLWHQGQLDALIRGRRYGDVTARRCTGQGLAHLGQNLARRFQLSGVSNTHRDDAIDLAKPGKHDLFGAKVTAHVFQQICQPLGLECGCIDLKQQIRAALKVEAQIQLLMRYPGRCLIQDLLRQDIGQGEHHAKQQGGDTSDHLPAGKIKHEPRLSADRTTNGVDQDLASFAAAGSPRVRTSVIMALMTLTVTPVAISTPTSASSTRATLPITPLDRTTVSPRLIPAIRA